MSEEWVDPVALRTKASDFETEVGAAIERANGHLQGAPRDVAFPAFSMVGGFMAGAYVEALNYTLADVDTNDDLAALHARVLPRGAAGRAAQN